MWFSYPATEIWETENWNEINFNCLLCKIKLLKHDSIFFEVWSNLLKKFLISNKKLFYHFIDKVKLIIRGLRNSLNIRRNSLLISPFNSKKKTDTVLTVLDKTLVNLLEICCEVEFVCKLKLIQSKLNFFII